jgi:hypothetical protein
VIGIEGGACVTEFGLGVDDDKLEAVYVVDLVVPVNMLSGVNVDGAAIPLLDTEDEVERLLVVDGLEEDRAVVEVGLEIDGDKLEAVYVVDPVVPVNILSGVNVDGAAIPLLDIEGEVERLLVVNEEEEDSGVAEVRLGMEEEELDDA